MITEENCYGALTYLGSEFTGAVFLQPDPVRPEKDWQGVLDDFMKKAVVDNHPRDIIGTYAITAADGGILITCVYRAVEEPGTPAGIIDTPLPRGTYGLIRILESSDARHVDALLAIDESGVEEAKPILLACQVDHQGRLVAYPLETQREKWRVLGYLLISAIDIASEK